MSTREPLRREILTAKRPVTYDVLLRIPENGKQHELYEGELRVTPSANSRHQEVVGNLFILLSLHVRERDLGRVFTAPLDVIFDRKNVAQPDILFVSKRRLRIIGPRVNGAPDLAIEVLSEDRAYDRVTKRRQYRKFGVKHFWIVDPEARTLEELVLRRGEYKPRSTLSGDEAFRSAIFPDLEIPLAQVWA